MNFLFYFLNVACSSGQSAMTKDFASKGGRSSLFNINKAFAGSLLFFLLGLIGGFSFHIPTWLFGAGYGISLYISMFTGFKALALGPMALTSIIGSFSLIIPFLFGITVFQESLTSTGIIGMCFLLSAIVLLNFKKEGGVSLKWSVFAFGTLLANGICSLVQKYHQVYYPGQYRNEFMLAAMLTTFVLLLPLELKNQERIRQKFCPHGIIAGLMNVSANYILLYLAATEKASVLFPVVSVANVITVWLIGRLKFKERLKGLQVFGLLAGVIAIVLLNL